MNVCTLNLRFCYYIIIIIIIIVTTTAIISVVDCSTDIEILYGLPNLFSVVPVKVPKGNWRPNRAQIRQGFLLHLQVSIMYDITLG